MKTTLQKTKGLASNLGIRCEALTTNQHNNDFKTPFGRISFEVSLGNVSKRKEKKKKKGGNMF